MKLLAIALLAVLVSGCAHSPPPSRPQVHVLLPTAKAAPAAVTPNATVKKRFWDRFPKHPKFFHQ